MSYLSILMSHLLRINPLLRDSRFGLINFLIELMIIFFYVPGQIYQFKIREQYKCISRNDSANHFLRVHDYNILTSNKVRVIALDDLVVGTLICGPKLFTRRPSDLYMFFHNPNSLSVLHHITCCLFAHGRHHYSWLNYNLLQDSINNYIHPSCPFASTSDFLACFPRDITSTNIFFHFLPNGYTVEVVVALKEIRDRLIQNSDLAIHNWSIGTGSRNLVNTYFCASCLHY